MAKKDIDTKNRLDQMAKRDILWNLEISAKRYEKYKFYRSAKILRDYQKQTRTLLGGL
tara:strand:+ start:189 stop:362 length:174 start_codon:yes stop_codon:yes gene_type:complete